VDHSKNGRWVCPPMGGTRQNHVLRTWFVYSDSPQHPVLSRALTSSRRYGRSPVMVIDRYPFRESSDEGTIVTSSRFSPAPFVPFGCLF